MTAKKSSETKIKERPAKESAPDKEQAVSAFDGSYASTSGDAASQQRVSERAFQLYEDRGTEDGHALDDWLQAEQEIIGPT